MGEEPRPGGQSVDALAWRLVRVAGWGETQKREEEEDRDREREKQVEEEENWGKERRGTTY
eukprot:5900231-Pyramimonas_sp.AAC.1